MRKSLSCVIAAALCTAVMTSAPAAGQTSPGTGPAAPGSGQPYPAKPIRLVVGFAAGGPTDIIARVLAQHMTAPLGQTVVVENRTGANAIIATDLVARAAPDGYTALFSSLSLLVNAILSPDKIKYDPFKDFAPVSNAASLPMVVVTRPSTPVNSMRELIALAKRRPAEVTYGSAGHGGSAHLAGAMLETMGNVRMTHVSFRGNAPALIDVMSGQVTFMVYPIIGIAEFVSANKLKVLAVGTAKRHPDFPSVPTAAESGFAGFEQCAPWVGMLVPAGTPTPIVNRLSDEMRKALAKPEVVTRLNALGAEIIGDTPAEFAAFLKKDYERWTRVIRTAGVKAE
ncbi:MAG TPA: tripartite tricarboxylate transporter substrate binding protein [Burkholderiales bacterium]|nr:tripartite tricarboxylate transporter substrate binding protein [Burkholderiales bacterium]